MQPIVYIQSKRSVLGGVEFDINVEGRDGRYYLRFYLTTDLSQDIPTTIELEIVDCAGGIRYRHDDLGMVVPDGQRLVTVHVPAEFNGRRVSIQAAVTGWSLLDVIAEAAR